MKNIVSVKEYHSCMIEHKSIHAWDKKRKRSAALLSGKVYDSLRQINQTERKERKKERKNKAKNYKNQKINISNRLT